MVTYNFNDAASSLLPVGNHRLLDSTLTEKPSTKQEIDSADPDSTEVGCKQMVAFPGEVLGCWSSCCTHVTWRMSERTTETTDTLKLISISTLTESLSPLAGEHLLMVTTAWLGFTNYPPRTQKPHSYQISYNILSQINQNNWLWMRPSMCLQGFQSATYIADKFSVVVCSWPCNSSGPT